MVVVAEVAAVVVVVVVGVVAAVVVMRVVVAEVCGEVVSADGGAVDEVDVKSSITSIFSINDASESFSDIAEIHLEICPPKYNAAIIPTTASNVNAL